MNKSGFTEFELNAIGEHKRELKEEEASIHQAIKDFGLDRLSRDRLEREAAKNLLELNNLVDRVNLLSKIQMEKILEALGFFNGNPTGILKKALEKGIQQQKSGFARENANKQVASRPSSIALNKIEEQEYPSYKHLFHLSGRINEFAIAMHSKYPEIKNIETIKKLIGKLNKRNGINQKK